MAFFRLPPPSLTPLKPFPRVLTPKTPARASTPPSRTRILKVAITGSYRKVDSFVTSFGTNLTLWCDISLERCTSAKIPSDYRGLVVLVDFAEAWQWVTQTFVCLEHYAPRMPVYVVYLGGPLKGTPEEAIREVLRDFEVPYEVLSVEGLRLALKKLSVAKTATSLSTSV